jgi:hypothetical protein
MLIALIRHTIFSQGQNKFVFSDREGTRAALDGAGTSGPQVELQYINNNINIILEIRIQTQNKGSSDGRLVCSVSEIVTDQLQQLRTNDSPPKCQDLSHSMANLVDLKEVSGCLSCPDNRV